MSSYLKGDPGRTLSLRKSFILALRRRFVALAKEVGKYVDDDDSLGLERSEPLRSLLQNADPGNIGSDPEKVKAFQIWFKQKYEEGVLGIEDGVDPEKPWTTEYVSKGYKKGYTTGYEQVNKKKKVITEEAIFLGSKIQFLQDAFNAPEATSKLELLGMRAYTRLKGITAEIDAEMTRILVEGLAAGHGTKKISKALMESIGSFDRVRAVRIANTEIMYAHAEGQLDSFERLGITEVGLLAEWLTAGDTRVCYRCQAHAGQRLTIAEARGLIPLHPNCRCIWVPFFN